MTIPERFEKTFTLMQPYSVTPHAGYVTNLMLAEQVAAVKGAIVECGVWKGGLIAGIAHLLGDDREYWLCDSFQGLPDVESVDGAFAKQWVDDPSHDGFVTTSEAAKEAMALAGVSNYRLVEGWFHDTLPTLEFPDGIAFLRVDADWYTPMMQALEALFPHVNAGGIISIDDYFFLEGCSKAVHDYLSQHQRCERIETVTDAHPWELPTDGVVFLRKLN